ncbi:MAG TPA: SH3 domain-containing protein [Candidatus Limnocylindrales bacterium]|nr:SH3 domain-containing protein [Candidatus Limnocylindrales bacterium]
MATPHTPPRTLVRHRQTTRVWLLSAVLGLFGGLLVSVSQTAAAGSTTMIPACSGVNVRAAASTSSSIRTRLATSAKVTVVATVSGSHWSTTCPGAKSGSSWYRISAINGKSVSSVYGQSYLYAATGVLGALPSSTPDATDVLGNDLTRLLNLDRVALGKKPYLVDARLAQIARDAPFTCPTNASLHLHGRAQDLADRHYFSHTVPGCFSSGTTPFRSIAIVRSVFGYTLARSEILHWNGYGTATTSYRLGCDIDGAHCAGGTTTAPYTVTLAQRNFMSSAPHRAAELNSYQRVGCASAKGGGRTYFACLFADGGPATTSPTATASSSAMVPACSGVNIRTGTTTTSAIKTRLGTSAKVTVVATVSGSHWNTTCPGAKSGSTWYRISAINGKSVSSLYGRSYLYAATGVLKKAS